MNRKEAIQWLEAMKSAYALPIETYEATELAIEALSDMSEEEVDYCNNCPYISWGDDCISRKDAIEEIALHDCTNGKVPNFTGREVQLILNNLPPVTPPERTGEWMQGDQDKLLGVQYCTMCGAKVDRYGANVWNYCPNCGAKMGGDSE